MRLFRVTRDWNRRDIFRREKKVTAYSTQILTLVKFGIRATKWPPYFAENHKSQKIESNYTEKDMKSVTHMQLIKFGGA
jgi:hypothetical protein